MAEIIRQSFRTTPLSELRHHPQNPRRGHVHSIERSIEENGFYGTVVAQEGTGYVLAGNHRLDAAESLGLAELPVAWIECDDATARKILAVDNRTADLASNDNQLLAELLTQIANEGGLAGTGYDEESLESLLRSLGADAPEYQPTNREIDPDALLGEEALKCPRCGFEFEQ